MKSLIVALTVALSVASTQASTQTDQNLQACREFADLAVSALEARYRGIALIDLLEAYRRAEITPEEEYWRTTAEGLAVSAYDLPFFSTPEMRAQQIRNLRNDMELACIREMQ